MITPALDPVEHAAEAVTAAPDKPATDDRTEAARVDSDLALRARAFNTERVTRATRRTIMRPVIVRSPRRTTILAAARTVQMAGRAVSQELTPALAPALTPALSPALTPAIRPEPVRAPIRQRSDDRQGGGDRESLDVSKDFDGHGAFEEHQDSSERYSSDRSTRVAHRVHQDAERVWAAPIRPVVRQQHVVRQQRTLRRVVVRHAETTQAYRRVAVGGGMNAVIAFAKSQIGRRYVTGGQGSGGFDCSGLTMRAYAQAGIRLPHSSYAQAARSRSVSRAQARAGDLVIGPGHVGIYMGNGMMIDAGNHRTGVVYRHLYSGLRVARLPG